MSMLDRVISRRAFLKLNVHLPIFIAGLQIGRFVPAGLLQPPPCPLSAYGSGAYGTDCYGGYCAPIGDVFPDVPDGIVDLRDIQAIADRWRRRAGDADWDARFDLDGDNVITIEDVMPAVTHMGETCS